MKHLAFTTAKKQPKPVMTGSGTKQNTKIGHTISPAARKYGDNLLKVINAAFVRRFGKQK